MKNTLDTQLVQVGILVDQFKYSDEKSFRGPCPVCGGHRRFVIFTDHEYPMNFGFCDACGYKLKAWERVKAEVDPVKRKAWQARALQVEHERALELDRLLAKYSAEEIWAAYQRRMGEEQRTWWRGRGVPDEWQDYLRLGYTEDRPYRAGEELKHSSAYTIPYFGPGWKFHTMQYRLTDPANPADRYRFEAGLGSHYYHTAPSDEAPGDVALICEGAIKAIVARVYGAKGMTVLAVPSKSTWRNTGVLEAVKNCGRVYVLLDPDAGRQAAEMKSAIGKAALVVSLFDKVDDCFTQFGMTAGQFAGYLRQAV